MEDINFLNFHKFLLFSFFQLNIKMEFNFSYNSNSSLHHWQIRKNKLQKNSKEKTVGMKYESRKYIFNEKDNNYEISQVHIL